jgi:MoaA/NifB/PqqE/SkfB family radical SAM enzyme
VAVELIDICNLNCSYCLRDEDSLRGKAHALPVDRLRALLVDLNALGEKGQLVFTGGEPTLHPDFSGILQTTAQAGWKYVVVTNGWNFARVLPALLNHRDHLSAVALSFDGQTREAHDAFRGKGSFDRLMKAVAYCRLHELLFRVKMTVDRDKARIVQELADYAARLGAEALELAPLFPTNADSDARPMGVLEQKRFLREIELLKKNLTMPIRLAAGFFMPTPEPTCGPLRGETLNVDYNGSLTLCSVLSGFRGQKNDRDRIADLRSTSLVAALAKLDTTIAEQNERRRRDFEALKRPADATLTLGSSCLHCLGSFGKLPVGFEAQKTKTTPRPDSYEATAGIVEVEGTGGARLLLDPLTQHVDTLNETAALVWTGVKEGASVDEIAQRLCAAFEISDAGARESVYATLLEFESRGLVQPRNASATAGA